jgi:hypothetical protein
MSAVARTMPPMADAVIHLPIKQDAASAYPAAVPVPAEPAQPVSLPIIAVAAAAPAAPRWEPPILGSLAVIFGVASLFTGTLVLAPLAVLLAIAAALFRQISWSVIGGASAVVALATSKYFWALLGLAWLLDWLI